MPALCFLSWPEAMRSIMWISLDAIREAAERTGDYPWGDAYTG